MPGVYDALKLKESALQVPTICVQTCSPGLATTLSEYDRLSTPAKLNCLAKTIVADAENATPTDHERPLPGHLGSLAHEAIDDGSSCAA